MKSYLKPYDIAKMCDDSASPGRRTYSVKCPIHEDKTASLHISQGQKATVLHCHAGCGAQDILDELEVQMQQLYHNYDSETNQDPNTPASLKLTQMMRDSKAPEMLELAPHESLYDVLYAVLEVTSEVWATVYLRWEDELMKPFPEQIDERNMMDAICQDLLEDHIQKGWKWTPQRRVILLTKLHNEWAKGRPRE
ncbi:MAG: hypothetical protein DRQ39_10460 [Gammaproteobacteria bacterium]|nr:MAG: hypothetical protein DRQ39_10460 [Gammaproteobacteria bacterium]